MQQEDTQHPGADRYPGGYVPAPSIPPPPTLETGAPASVGERHPVNLSELDDRYVLQMAAPGACPSDFFVRVDIRGILIGREHAGGEACKSGMRCRHEFDVEPFRRFIPMPAGVDVERVTAAYANGILQLILPKGETGTGGGVIEVPVY